MTSQRLNKAPCFPTGVGTFFCAVVVILFITIASASGIDENLLYRTTYSSFSEFAIYSCLPCHYNERTTNLIPLLKEKDEKQLMEFLEKNLLEGGMPPDEELRSVLFEKFRALKERLAGSADH